MDENQAAYEENVQTPVEAPAEEKSGFFKKNRKKLLVAAGALVCVVILLCVIIGTASNTYNAPMNSELKRLNYKFNDKLFAGLNNLNGFCEKDINKAVHILKKSDKFNDYLDKVNDSIKYSFKGAKSSFGNDFKITAKLSYKEDISERDF